MIPFQVVFGASCVCEKATNITCKLQSTCLKKSCNGYFADVRTAVGNGCLKQWKQNCKKKKYKD